GSSPASRCSTGAPTRPRRRWSGWCRCCGRAGPRCSTCSGARRTWRRSAPSSYPGRTICACWATPSPPRCDPTASPPEARLPDGRVGAGSAAGGGQLLGPFGHAGSAQLVGHGRELGRRALPGQVVHAGQQAGVDPEGGQVPEQQGVLPVVVQAVGQGAGAPGVDRPALGQPGDVLQVRVLLEDGGSRLL